MFVYPEERRRLTSTDMDLVSGSLGQAIMVMMSTSMKFTISKSFMTRVCFALSIFALPKSIPTIW